MSGAIWFIGDLHFGHEKVSGLRGFRNTASHDAAIISRWERQVSDGDVVYVLGDISGGSRSGEFGALEILGNLPGRKRLVAGNHDSISSIHRTLSPHTELFRDVFERIGDFARIKTEQRQVLLSHYPYDEDHTEGSRYIGFRLPNLGLPLIHAHTHSTEQTAAGNNQLCVSWDAWSRLANMGDVNAWLRTVPPTPSIMKSSKR